MALHDRRNASPGSYSFTRGEDGSSARLPYDEEDGFAHRVLVDLDAGMGLQQQLEHQVQHQVRPLEALLARPEVISRRYGIDPEWSVNAIVIHMHCAIVCKSQRKLFDALLQGCQTKDQVVLLAVDTVRKLRSSER